MLASAFSVIGFGAGAGVNGFGVVCSVFGASFAGAVAGFESVVSGAGFGVLGRLGLDGLNGLLRALGGLLGALDGHLDAALLHLDGERDESGDVLGRARETSVAQSGVEGLVVAADDAHALVAELLLPVTGLGIESGELSLDVGDGLSRFYSFA